MPRRSAAMHATPLPDDLAACHALIVEQARTITEQVSRSRQSTIQEQQLTINELLQRAFRHRSERYLEDPNQLKLDFGNTPEAADAAAGLAEAVEEAEILVAAHKRRKRVPRKPRNEQLPAHLPRYEVEAPVPDDVKHCAEHGRRKLIGYDRTETLEFERPKLKVRVTLYPKYICENEPACGVAPAAARAGAGRREPLRHERGGGDRHRQVRLSPADLSRAGLLRRLRLDGGPEHAVEHLPGVGRVGPSAGVVPAWRGARQRSDRHGRDAGDAVVAAGDPGGQGGRSRSRGGSTRCSAKRGPKGARASRGGCGPTAA